MFALLANMPDFGPTRFDPVTPVVYLLVMWVACELFFVFAAPKKPEWITNNGPMIMRCICLLVFLFIFMMAMAA